MILGYFARIVHICDGSGDADCLEEGTSRELELMRVASEVVTDALGSNELRGFERGQLAVVFALARHLGGNSS